MGDGRAFKWQLGEFFNGFKNQFHRGILQMNRCLTCHGTQCRCSSVPPRSRAVDVVKCSSVPPRSRAVDVVKLSEAFLEKCGKGAKTDVNALHDLLDRGADADYVDSEGWTALFYGAAGGHLDVVKALFLLFDRCGTLGSALQRTDTYGGTALWNTCFNGERMAATLLLSRGAPIDVNGETADGVSCSPAMAARLNNSPGLADTLDAEARLRLADSTRQAALLEGAMDEAEFRRTLKEESSAIVAAK